MLRSTKIKSADADLVSRKEPLHAKTRRLLLEQILNNFQQDQRFHSERELVRDLKISPHTVRHALRDLVSEGYLKPALRRGLFVQKLVPTRYVGLVCLTESTASEAVEPLSLVCRNNNVLLNVYPVHRGDDVDDILRSIRYRAIEERIILTGLPKEFSLKLGAKLQAKGYKHLVVGPKVGGFTGGCLYFDHDAEVDMILDHLVGLGHKRIVFMVNEPRILFTTSQRAEAVKRKLKERELTCSSLVDCGTKIWEASFDAAYRKTGELWTKAARRPTAIVPLSGAGSLGVMRYAFEHGIRIPGDLSTMSFDPIANSEFLHIPLTELTFSYAERAEKALQMLWADCPSVLSASIDSKLIVRETTSQALR